MVATIQTPNGRSQEPASSVEQVHLIVLGRGQRFPWSEGHSLSIDAEPAALSVALSGLLEDAAKNDAILTWDRRLGVPEHERIRAVAQRRGDCWHAGLRLGLGGLPEALDHVHPTWMLNRDPLSDIEATSWRLSLRACLAPVRLWRQLGGPDRAFESLDAAGLEMGHRWLWAGLLLRHVPELVPEDLAEALSERRQLTTDDEFRFLRRRVGQKWTYWAAMRSVLSGRRPALEVVRSLRRTRDLGPSVTEKTGPVKRDSLTRFSDEGEPLDEGEPRVTVLVPTIDRYPYLETLLGQLEEQTRPPDQVLVIDQTPPTRRRRGWHQTFSALPLEVIELDEAGQCSSRNAGLQIATGDLVLFLDDDDEIASDLLERHVQCMRRSRADGICGVADEVGAGPLPEDFRRFRASDIFPTNNGSVRREALEESGLFDLAFDQGSRADADLGMRLYLSGALLVLDPSISVLHHHAPRGGLRTHGARRVTYASSRRRIRHRHLPAKTEIYYFHRYFTRRQAREAEILRIVGTLVGQGTVARRVLKAIHGMLTLPASLWHLHKTRKAAKSHLRRYPEIPLLSRSGPSTTPTE